MRNSKKVFVLMLCICCFAFITIVTIYCTKNNKIEYDDFNEKFSH